ncbi:MAG: ribosome maturation factor RimP [Myxococcota bacterium]
MTPPTDHEAPPAPTGIKAPSPQPEGQSPGPSAGPSSGPAAGAVRVVRPDELVEEAVGPVVEAMGYELLLAEFTGSGKHRRLVLYLDRAEGGISLDDCSKMSPVISSTLDAAEADPNAHALARVLKAPYALEVSSPGIDRPLAKLSHFRRHVGGLAKVTTFSPLDAGSKQKNFNGRIESVLPSPSAPDDDRAGTVTLVDPDGGAHYSIELDQIRRANLVYEA